METLENNLALPCTFPTTHYPLLQAAPTEYRTPPHTCELGSTLRMASRVETIPTGGQGRFYSPGNTLIFVY